MFLFGNKIKTWEDLLGLEYHPAHSEKGIEKHGAYYYPTKELALITLQDVKKLLKKGLDPNWKDACGKPLLAHLMEARPPWGRTQLWNGTQPHIIEYLLQNGANPNVSFTDVFKEQRTLFEYVTYGNLYSHEEANDYTRLLLKNGINLDYQNAGAKALGELLTSAIPQDGWQQRAKMILDSGQIDIEKPVFSNGKESILEKVKDSYLSDHENQDFLYQYYKQKSPEKAEIWYQQILIKRQQQAEYKRLEEQKRKELADYKKKKQPSVDPLQILQITGATLGVVSACYKMADASRQYHERCVRANSPLGKLKHLFGFKSY